MKKRDINLTRRNFIFGGTASLASLAAVSVLGGCVPKKEGVENLPDHIVANISYFENEINPVANISPFGRSCLWHVSEGLYNIDYSTYKTYNGLAALSPIKIDDLTYEVPLKHNAVYSNGQSVSVHDVVNAFNLSMNDKIFKPALAFISSCQVKDEKTVTFKLNYPVENNLQLKLASVFIFPSNIDINDLKKQPIGSGPWMVDLYETENDSSILFVPNPYYQGKYSVDDKAMRWNFVDDNDARIDSLLKGQAYVSSDVVCSDERKINAAHAVIESFQGYKSGFIMFNCNRAPFDDVRTRKAFFHAFNINRICSKVFNGSAVPASSIFPTTHPNFHKSSIVYEHNVEKSKQLLSSVGASIINAKMLFDKSISSRTADRVIANLSEAGINVDVDFENINFSNFDDFNFTKNYDAIFAYCDPSLVLTEPEFLLNYWYGDNSWMNDWSSWKAKEPNKWQEINTAINNGREAKEADKKQNYWNKAVDLIFDNCPILPLFHNEITTLYYPENLDNFKPISSSALSFLGSNIRR